MSLEHLDRLETRINTLLLTCETLHKENQQLRKQNQHLLDKQHTAAEKLKQLVPRLEALDNPS